MSGIDPLRAWQTYDIDWTSLRMDEVWAELGGPEVRWKGGRGRAPAWWRDGDNRQAISLDRERNVWHDFVTGEGGGPIRLAEIALDVDRRTAVKWIAERFGVAGDLSSADARRTAGQWKAQKKLREYARLWRLALIREYEFSKRHAWKASVSRVDLETDWANWYECIVTSRELFVIEQLAGYELLAAFDAALRDYPEETARLVSDQREWEADALDLAAFVTAAIAYNRMSLVSRHVT